MSQSVNEMVDHLFRHSSGRVVASLARKLGLQHLQLAEDAVQEAVITALRLWPYRGVPANPEAWLRRVAFNRAIDVLRREGRKMEWDESISHLEAPRDEDVLSMMLICCHPAIPATSQTMLILRLVAGFSVPEIARAFLAKDSMVYQRIRRARNAIVEAGADLEFMDPRRSEDRLDALLAALYLLFNEGYAMSSGDRHISTELCDEAIRLVRLVADWDVLDRPEVDALLALMLLQAARLPARVGPDGEILTLSEQNRRLWDREMIDAGIERLNSSARGEALSSYHLQAGIASLHCLAPSYQETDWRSILDQYDALVEADQSSLIALNRVVAYAMVHGPAAGLSALDEMLGVDVLERYALYHATVGELADLSGDRSRALASYVRARQLVRSLPERRLLDQRLARYRPAGSNVEIDPDKPLTN